MSASAILVLAACSSFDGSAPDSAPDGAVDPTDAKPPLKISVRTVSAVRVVTSRLTPLSFHVDREGAASPITVVADGLPPGVTAKVVELAADASEGVISFGVDPSTRVDLTVPIVLRATSGGLFANAGLALTVVGPPGSLDTSFARSGVETLGPFDLRTPDVRGVAVGPDGSVTVVWGLRSATNERVGIWRLRSDGAVDPTFNGGQILEIPRDDTFPYGVALLSDGGALVYGNMSFKGAYWAMLARVTASGTLDETFGGDPQPGLARFSFDPSGNGTGGVSTNELIAGSHRVGASEAVVLAGRFDDLAALAQVGVSGAFSSDFNGGQPSRFSWTSPLHWRTTAMDVRADGLRAVLGTSDGAALTFVVDGQGGAHPATTPILVDAQAGATGKVAWLSDGSFLAVAQRAASLRVRRLDYPSLSPHAGFTEPTLVPTGANAVVGVVAMPGERAVIGSTDSPTRGASLTRIAADGGLDPAFGSGGQATVTLYDAASLGSMPAPTRAVMAAGADGRLVIAAGAFVGRVWNDP